MPRPDIVDVLDTVSVLAKAHSDLNGSLTTEGEDARRRIEAIIFSLVNEIEPITEAPVEEEAPPETA